MRIGSRVLRFLAGVLAMWCSFGSAVYMTGTFIGARFRSCLMASISSSVIVVPTSYCARFQLPPSDLRWGWYRVPKSPLR